MPRGKIGADLALALLTSLVRGLRKLGIVSSNGNRSTLVLPPAAPGNLGDDAMVSATLLFLRKSGVERLAILAFGKGEEWCKWQPDFEIIDLGVSRWRKARFVVTVMRFERFYCLGADIMDGYHGERGGARITELASLASAAGVRVSVLGFSFNDQPTPESVRALRRLPRDVRLCVRDPVSYRRLTARLDRPIELVADVAFLLEAGAGTTADSARQWIENEKSASRVVVGLNFNHRLFVRPDVAALDVVMGRFRDAVTALCDSGQGFSLVLIPHDYRCSKRYPGDVELAEGLLAMLPDEIRRHSMVVGRCRASEIRSICGQLDFVVTGLMHLAIAALERGTPLVCLSYQGKFEGLMSHLNIDGLNLDPEEALAGFKERVLPLIAGRDEIRNKIASRLPAIKSLAQANFT